MYKSFLFVLSVLSYPLSLALECNICGPGTDNIIGKPKGIVTLNYDGVARKQNCLKWQEGSFLDEEWCRINILNYTVWACGCLLPDGTTLHDVMEEQRTEAPTQTYVEEEGDNLDLPTGSRPDGGREGTENDLNKDNSGAKQWLATAALVLGQLFALSAVLA